MNILTEFDPWVPLQSAYGTELKSPGKPLRFQSALIDGARFVACLTYVFTEEGMYVKPMRLLPVGLRRHALFVSWNEIEIKKTDYWTTYPYEIHMKRTLHVDFRVRGRIGKIMLQCQLNSEKR
ncbi:hypothetical protein L4X63_21185 [Geomonas sp. Red32]|uniref:hypothetical protein n=1 Tax=Geomonas sp. Red32 TaxID=2912856 RepID=UPI00202CEE47|nr:hypothetical protein [Geomonas sp. Red32]MCM0084100.1 hypothetical protein [Geomonas sp. Red32]